MTWILEQPFYILLFGGLLLGLLFACLKQTADIRFLYAMIAALVLTLGLLALEHYVITPREEVEHALAEIALALQADDTPKLQSFIYSKSPELARAAAEKMKEYRLKTVSIKWKTLKVEFNDRLTPPEAVARFNIVVEGETKGGATLSGIYAAAFELVLRREQEVWRIESYVEMSPLEGLKTEKSARPMKKAKSD